MYLDRLFEGAVYEFQEDDEEEEERQQAAEGNIEGRPTCRVVPMPPTPASPTATIHLRTPDGQMEIFQASETVARRTIQVNTAFIRELQEGILLEHGPVVAIVMSRHFRNAAERAGSSLISDRGTH